MKKFHLIGEKTTQAFTEAHLVRAGYILAGTVGLVESIQAFKSRGFDVVVDDPATDPYVLTEASALTEGFFDAVKEKLASALQKVKSGEITKGDFDKYYDIIYSTQVSSCHSNIPYFLNNLRRNNCSIRVAPLL